MSELPAAIERSTTLREGETVVAYMHRSDQDWALLTTQRLRWLSAGTLTNLSVDRIIEREVITSKGRQPVMRFVSTDSEHHDMKMDEGAAFSAFWTAVSSAISLKQR